MIDPLGLLARENKLGYSGANGTPFSSMLHPATLRTARNALVLFSPRLVLLVWSWLAKIPPSAQSALGLSPDPD